MLAGRRRSDEEDERSENDSDAVNQAKTVLTVTKPSSLFAWEPKPSSDDGNGNNESIAQPNNSLPPPIHFSELFDKTSKQQLEDLGFLANMTFANGAFGPACPCCV